MSKINKRSLEENAERRKDEESLIADTVHVRLCYGDLLTIDNNGRVQIDTIGFQKRNLSDDPSDLHPDSDFVVHLSNEHIEKLQSIGGVIDFGLRYINGKKQFLFITAGGISDTIGQKASKEMVIQND